MADTTAPAAPPDVPTTVADAAPSVMAPEVIPTEAIPVLQGREARTDPGVLKPGTFLTGDEDLKSKVTVRTRYPIDSFTAEGVTVTAVGVKVDGSKLSGLVEKATANGVELERI